MFLTDYLKKQTEYGCVGTIAWKMRKKRTELFNKWFEMHVCDKAKNSPIRIIDIGGEPNYWKIQGFKHMDDVEITCLNRNIMNVSDDLKDKIISIKGDAVNIDKYANYSFDLAFSNSVIEHVGNYNNQAMMAKEMIRIAPHGYLQTPNKYFFMEPHFLFPFFQFLPIGIRAELVYRFQLGHFKKASSREEARKIVESVNLLCCKDLKALFPNAELIREKWMGLTKSIILRW